MRFKENSINKVMKWIRANISNFQFSKRASDLLISHIDKECYVDLWMTRPMNGQKERLRSSILLSEILKPEFAIESGAYLGTTTQYLSCLVTKKAFSIEINQTFAEIASRRLSSEIENGEIEIICGDSGLLFSSILSGINPQTERVIAYLDAHWLANIPLRYEIQSLLDWGGVFIALVDDFYIPDDNTYGFDQYEHHRIDRTHVPDVTELNIWVPAFEASHESGARRGTAYLVHNDINQQVIENARNLRIRPFLE